MLEKPTYEELERRIQELEKAQYEREQTELALQRRIEFEKMVAIISSELAGIGGGAGIDLAINRALSSIGTFTGADRAYIFSFKNVDTRADNTHEWCSEGIEPQIKNLKDIPIDEQLPWFAKHIRNHEVFHVHNVTDLPQKAFLEREHFEAQNIQSLIVVPMETTERLIGFLGFDAVTERRNWSDDDKTILQFFAQTLSHVIERKRAEEVVRENEKKYHTILDNASAVIFIKDKDGKYLYINRMFEDIHGIKDKKIHGLTDHDIFPRELANQFRKNDLSVLQSGKPIDAEEIVPHEDGIHTVISTKFPLVDKDGKIYAICGISTDLTHLKQAEEALRESENKYRTLVENSLQGMVIAQKDPIRVRYASKPMEIISGYACKELEGFSPDDLKELIHPDDRDRFFEAFLSRLSGNDFTPRSEYRIIHKNGTERWVEIFSVLIQYQGSPATQTAFMDITERKKSEHALRESEEKYRALFRNATDAIFIAQDTVLKFVNPKTEKVTGYSAEELTRIPFSNIVHPDDRDMVFERYSKRIEGKKLPSVYPFRIINSSGEELPVELNTVLINWEGRPATLNFLRDMTTQKKLETQLQQSHKMEAIGTLAGGIAHDFNNILGIILGNAELAMDDVPDWNPGRQNLEEVRKACLRAKDVVRQILSFSRKSEMEQKPINIATVVTESLKLLRASIPTSIDIRQNIANDIHDIFGNPTQIHQVMINLCTNAAHAMENEGEILEVALKNIQIDEDSASRHPELNPGSYVQLRVSDTGDGISTEVIDRIFDPYFTTKDVGKGTGLGLSVVHGIVKSHHGRISVESSAGEGTTFKILFPAVEGKTRGEPKSSQELPAGKERILFVDDEEPMVNLNKQRLEKLGYTVIPETDPSEALKFFRANHDQVDLVITDMTMPRMTGDRLTKEILKIRSDMPIILCTGYSQRMSEDKAQELGIRKYIEKPIEVENLAKSVREVLDEE